MARKRHRPKELRAYPLDHEQMAHVLRDRFESSCWWTFICVKRLGLHQLDVVEHRHYQGRSNKLFEAMSFPINGIGVVTIAFAHKSRMSPKQLAKLLDEWDMAHEAEHVAQGGGTDIIGFAESQEQGMRVAAALHQIAGIGS
jgi:hypothetical protein